MTRPDRVNRAGQQLFYVLVEYSSGAKAASLDLNIWAATEMEACARAVSFVSPESRDAITRLDCQSRLNFLLGTLPPSSRI